MSISAVQATARSSAPLADARLTNRLAVAFLLDVIAIARGDRHLVDTLLLASISQANVAAINRQADLQVAYAGAGAAPPDEMRRPVSMNAVASSLQLPFETVRRRVRAMAGKGYCVIAGGGVIVPTAVVTSAEYLSNAYAGYERLRGFYYQLRDLGLVRELPAPSVELGGELIPLRTVARLAADYVLRAIETVMRALGDLLEGVILLEIVRSNTEHLSAELRGGNGFEPSDFIADELRRPVSIAAVARRLGLPIETVRRHAGVLQARGLCRRAPGGLVVPAEVLARPALVAFMTGNLANLQRMFAALAQLGVLCVWDRLSPPV